VLMGGNAVFLIGNGWFKRLSAKWFPLSHYVGVGLCIGLALAGLYLPLWVSCVTGALSLAMVASWEHLSLSRAGKLA
jgi:low temperature requirement protein LtrA